MDKEILEQYKLEVETADRTTNRRYTFNNFMSAINVAIIAGLVKLATGNLFLPAIWISIAGFLLTIVWLYQIKNFQKMIKIKYDIIREIEDVYEGRLIKLFNKEHEKRDDFENQGCFIKFSTLEKAIVYIFIGIYLLSIFYFYGQYIIYENCYYCLF